MSFGNTEIEIRFKLSEEEFLQLRERLSKIAEFKKRSVQKDDYFSPSHRDFLDAEFVNEWLSIRRRGGKAKLNYKFWYLDKDSESGTHCDEFETDVENPESLEKIFAALNMRKLISVQKEREVYTYKGEYEIAFDKVKGLGFFMEIETIKDFGSVEKARAGLLDFAKTLKLDRLEPEKIGYPHMLLKMRGEIK
ncbi:MAG: class IV adenylate cyclase [Candidatus Aenigmarchaeota archaeon]|nr:class IV adenylate cyclase [Candidatus Aenigmarchaeota archaeon]